MRLFIFFISIFFWFSQTMVAQVNQLVYYKLIPGESDGLTSNTDTSGYVMDYGWASYDPSLRDIGVWNEYIINREVEGVEYIGAKLLYSNNLDPQDRVFYQTSHSNYNGAPGTDRILLNFNKSPAVNTNETDFLTYPAIEDYPSPTYGQNIFLAYDVDSEILNGVLNFSGPVLESSGNQPEPFSGYKEAVNYLSVDRECAQNTAMVNDSVMIAYVMLYDDEQTVNNTEVFSNFGQEINLLRIQVNLNTNEFSIEQIGSSSGSQHLLHVSSTRYASAVYRMGIVRGPGTPISVSGAEIEMSPNDSLYHVYMTKESIAGQTEWLTELYAYNNVYPDTVPDSLWINKLFVQNQLTSVVEKDDFLYVSAAFRSEAPLNDSLFYRDFMGQDHLYAHFSPWFNPMPEAHQIPFSESRIYKINTDGNVLGKLRTKYMVGQYTNATYSQETKLIEIGNRMAWLQAYEALNDTTMTYAYSSQDGSQQNTMIDLPAGKGIVIIWLDDDLQILDHWVIPFENDISQGMRINSIVPYHGDTLIIQGVLNENTTTDLNPFGQSETIEVDELSSFFAFYSVPGIFTRTKRHQSLFPIKIYPNPATQSIGLSGLQSGSTKYRIVDLTGRLLKQGSIDEDRKISVANLASGMYLLTVETGGKIATQRFLVE